MDLGLSGRQKYEWTDDELDALKERQLTRSGPTGFDRHWVVWNVKHEDGSMYIAKVVSNRSIELQAVRKMIGLSSSPKNHTIPAQIISCAQTSMILMPYLSTVRAIHWECYDESFVYDCIDKMLEGVEFMHENNMAFVDIAEDNAVVAIRDVTTPLFKVSAGALYFIDFGAARSFSSGPGTGVLITDWTDAGGHYEPPEGVDALDPFAYDIYCLGQSFADICEVATEPRSHIRIPRCMLQYTKWLSALDPQKRPSIWDARRVYRVLRLWIFAIRWIYGIFKAPQAYVWYHPIIEPLPDHRSFPRKGIGALYGKLFYEDG